MAFASAKTTYPCGDCGEHQTAMKLYAPDWEYLAVEEADDDGSKRTSKSKKRLCMVRWTAAFHAYALAAEAAEVSHVFIGLCIPRLPFLSCLCRYGHTRQLWLTCGIAWRLLHTQRPKIKDTASRSCTMSYVAKSGRRRQAAVRL